MSLFKPATRTKSRLRLSLTGPSGSGKTFTAIRLACLLGKRVAVIDSERGSASKYVGESPDGTPWAFDVLEMTPPFHPDRYMDAIRAAGEAGYDALVIDSLTHAWSGPGGLLEFVDQRTKHHRGDSRRAWAEATPIQKRFYDEITAAPLHVIATMRSKTAYEVEKDDRGKTVMRKVGLQAEQRDGAEYEFDVACDVTHDHDVIVGKTRCSALTDKVFRKPGPELADPLRAWLSDGAEPAPRPQPEPVREQRQPVQAHADGESPKAGAVLVRLKALGVEGYFQARYPYVWTPAVVDSIQADVENIAAELEVSTRDLGTVGPEAILDTAHGVCGNEPVPLDRVGVAA